MHDDPAAVLESVRPEARLISPNTLPHKILQAHWDLDNTVDTYVCHEISRSETDRCMLGFYRSRYEGTFPMFLRFGASDRATRSGLPSGVASAIERVVDRGRTADGPVQWSYYLYGANLEELRRTGLRLAEADATVLREAVCNPLLGLHVSGRAHSALTSRRIRLVAVPEPYTSFDTPAPIRLCGYRGTALTQTLAAQEIEVAVAAVDALTGGNADRRDLWAAVAECCPLIEEIDWGEGGEG